MHHIAWILRGIPLATVYYTAYWMNNRASYRGRSPLTPKLVAQCFATMVIGLFLCAMVVTGYLNWVFEEDQHNLARQVLWGISEYVVGTTIVLIFVLIGHIRLLRTYIEMTREPVAAEHQTC